MGVEGQLLAAREPQPRVAARQLGDGDLGLQLGEGQRCMLTVMPPGGGGVTTGPRAGGVRTV